MYQDRNISYLLLSLEHSTAVEMISITLVTSTKILDMINDFGENLLGQNGEIGW
jgi:hypothetical protein